MRVATLLGAYRDAQAAAREVAERQARAAGPAAIALEGELAEAFDRQFALERQIRETPADALRDIGGKLQIGMESAEENAGCAELESEWLMVASASRDLAALAGARNRAGWGLGAAAVVVAAFLFGALVDDIPMAAQAAVANISMPAPASFLSDGLDLLALQHSCL